MANMSYCRFENTLQDLLDCKEHMFDPTKRMSDYEKRARKRMFEVILEMAKSVESMSEDELENGNPAFGDGEEDEF